MNIISSCHCSQILTFLNTFKWFITYIIYSCNATLYFIIYFWFCDLFIHILLSLLTYKQIYLLVSKRTSALFLWFYINDYRLHDERLIPTSRFLSLLLCPEWPWCPYGFLFIEYWELFLWVYSIWRTKLTTPLCLVPRLRMNEAVPWLHHTMS
jgi:hypothetical protein